MPINMDDRGYIFWEDSWHTPSLGIRSSQLEDCIDEVRRRKLKGVFGTVPYFTERNLDFLAKLPEIESAQFYDINLDNLDGLYYLKRLTHLRISGKRSRIDFSLFKNLSHLVWEYRNNDTGGSTLEKLKFLNLWRYKSKDKNISNEVIPQNITSLGLYWSNVESISNIPILKKLRRLEIARCRNLNSLRGLERTCPNLQHLVIDACGRLEEIEAKRVAELIPSLKHFYAAKKLIIGGQKP